MYVCVCVREKESSEILIEFLRKNINKICYLQFDFSFQNNKCKILLYLLS